MEAFFYVFIFDLVLAFQGSFSGKGPEEVAISVANFCHDGFGRWFYFGGSFCPNVKEPLDDCIDISFAFVNFYAKFKKLGMLFEWIDFSNVSSNCSWCIGSDNGFVVVDFISPGGGSCGWSWG